MTANDENERSGASFECYLGNFQVFDVTGEDDEVHVELLEGDTLSVTVRLRDPADLDHIIEAFTQTRPRVQEIFARRRS